MRKEILKSNKIIVAMSGGVDSSVAAAILKKKGFDVQGVFFLMRDEDDARQRKSLEDANRVAKKLEIPLDVFDLRKKFRKIVMDNFVNQYRKGMTPNPCVICNPRIKFESLFRLMRKHKADLVATGHYARIIKLKEGRHSLKKATDEKKDQSYFLWGLEKEQLEKIVFPLGAMTKKNVRILAEKWHLPVAKNRESQDICFIDGSTSEYLSGFLCSRPGLIRNKEGEVLGKHLGLFNFTLGQRKGIDIGGKGPYFVCGKDMKKNILVVTNDLNCPALFSKKMTLKNVNWLEKLEKGKRIELRTRYRNPLVSAIIKTDPRKKGDRVEVEFIHPQKIITNGQSAVFYSSNGIVLGGGIIN